MLNAKDFVAALTVTALLLAPFALSAAPISASVMGADSLGSMSWTVHALDHVERLRGAFNASM